MIRSVLLLLVAVLFTSPVAAQTFPVDDSASHVLEAGPVNMRWNTLVPQPGQASTMTGQVVVLVRLDVSPWRGRRARIYQTLPSQPIGPVDVRWTANGPALRLNFGDSVMTAAAPWCMPDRSRPTGWKTPSA